MENTTSILLTPAEVVVAKYANGQRLFVGLDITNADFRYANFEYAIFQDCYLPCADLSGARLRHTTLVSTELRGVKLGRADLCGAKFNSCSMPKADLQNAFLCRASVIDSDLYGAVVGGAYLYEVDFTGTRLELVDFYNADMDEIIVDRDKIDAVTYDVYFSNQGKE